MSRLIKAAICAALIAVSTSAGAQILNLGAGSTGVGHFVPPTGCTNQLVLDYSNSCALIAQAWGQ